MSLAYVRYVWTVTPSDGWAIYLSTLEAFCKPNILLYRSKLWFSFVVAHNKKNCVVKHNFLRSGHTTSKHFHRVLKSIIKLYNVLLARPTPITEECVDPRLRWFKWCLKALDGTFIDIRVPKHEKGRYQTRKGQVAVNVLGVCNPNINSYTSLPTGRGTQLIAVFYVMPSTDQVV